MDNSKAKEILKWDYEYPFFDVIDMLIEEELAFEKDMERLED